MRCKLWEQPDYQCSIIGTCLCLAEQLKLARRTGIELPDSAGEFQVHSALVFHSRQDGPVARAVHKHLDKKFAGAVRRFSRARDDEAVLDLWREAKDSGDIPGPYWAVLSHGWASAQVKTEVFGDVHMLSHLVGSANRADIRRLAEMEARLNVWEDRFARFRAASKRRVRALARDKRELQKRLACLAKEAEAYRQDAMRSGSAALAEENEGLKRSLAAQSVMLMESDLERERLRRLLDANRLGLRDAQAAMADRTAEVEALEAELLRVSAGRIAAAPCDCDRAGTAACPGPDLCGRRILYVGGRANLVRHYRDTVERCGGVFLHHDGGLEEADSLLPGLLGGVDAVVCPVDCVSHNACRRVKEACRRRDMPLKLVRSSGLSSLLRCLGDLAAQAEARKACS